LIFTISFFTPNPAIIPRFVEDTKRRYDESNRSKVTIHLSDAVGVSGRSSCSPTLTITRRPWAVGSPGAARSRRRDGPSIRSPFRRASWIHSSRTSKSSWRLKIGTSRLGSRIIAGTCFTVHRARAKVRFGWSAHRDEAHSLSRLDHIRVSELWIAVH
jgi:hypothetical protein